MKKIYFYLFVFVLCLNTTIILAQKPDRERVGIIEYIQLPLEPLPEDYKIYLIEPKSQWGDPYRNDEIVKHINLQGFEKKTSGESDFRIMFEEYPFRLGDSELQRHESKKKVDGVEKTVYSYSYNYNITYKGKIEVYSKTNEVLFSQVYDRSGKKSTRTYSTSSTAYDKFNEEVKQLKKSVLIDCIKSANIDINSKYGYPKKSLYVTPFRIKVKKKKYDYSDYEEAFNLFKEGLEFLIADENDIESAKPKIEPAIDKWNAALAESDLNDKKARVNLKVTCATYYNIGYSYLILKDFDKSLENFEKCIDIKKGFSDAIRMISIVTDFKTRSEANQ